MDQEQHSLTMTDAREILLFAQRNAKFVALITVGMMVVAVALALSLPPRFMGESVIMLDPRKTHVSNMESVMTDLPADNAVVRSEVDTIRSRSVTDRVIDQLNLLTDPHFNKRLAGPDLMSRLFHFAAKPPLDAVEQAAADRTAAAHMLEKHLDVVNDGRSYSITIRYYDSDAAMAARIANAYTDQYLVDQLEVKYEATQRANSWLHKRLDELKDKVTSSDRAVEDYRTAHHLIDVNMAGGGQQTITQQQLSELDVQLLQARAEQAQAEARLNGVRGLNIEQIESSSAIISSPLIQQLKQQEAEVRRKVADLATRYGERHPEMIDARNELNGIQDKIGEEVRKIVAGLQNDVNVARAKADSLQQGMTRLTAQTGEGNQAMITLRQLQREADSNRTLYQGLLDRFKQVTEQQDLQIADARVIARADQPIKPYFPKLWIFLVAGTSFGLVIGFLIALLLEYLDRGIRSLNIVEKTYGVPALGIVPLTTMPDGQTPTDYILKKPLSVYAESIRSIRAAIHFSDVDHPPKVVMITSSFPGEGKTIFSTSFARVLAKSGLKVLLIDADMRRPRVYSVLHLDKTKPDLAKVLAHDVPLEQAIQKDASGADVLIAHTKPPNPQNLLASHQMEKLLTQARKDYDMILIDTPPVIAISDAAILAKMADSVIYAIRWASTPLEVVGEGVKQLERFNVKISGAVLTQVNLQDRKRYGYQDYSYYHGHYKRYYSN